MTSLLAAVFGLVMIEQFYRGLPSDSRWAFKPLMLGLVAIFAFDLYLFAEGSLFLRLDPATWSVRGLAHVLILPLIGISVARNPSWNMRISVSRDVVFHSSALLISGVYLLLVAGAGYYVRFSVRSGVEPFRSRCSLRVCFRLPQCSFPPVCVPGCGYG